MPAFAALGTRIMFVSVQAGDTPLETVYARLREAGLEVERRTSGAPGQARRIAAEVAEQARALEHGQAAGPARLVIAVGGDGTMHEVADGLAGSPVPMVIWPTGT